MDKQIEDTIAAIATPPGSGSITVIRVSGPASIPAADSMFTGRGSLADASSHTIHYGTLKNDEGKVLDDVLISVFREPNSYTGEDSVEISTHGSPFIAARVIQLLMERGVRQAEPGEFTKRAFLNGKMDLAQAEAVAELINSRTKAAHRGARNQLDGFLSEKVKSLRSSLLDVVSLTELELDFAEEDLEFVPDNTLIEKINVIIAEVNGLIDSYSYGKIVRDGVNVALVGAPNVGKSSLLNYVLKEYRAIVSEIPGTTRDVIREEISVDGILMRFFDTAGIRKTEDAIEIEGVERSRGVVRDSDIVVFLNDAQIGVDNDVRSELVTLVENEKIITVINKIDLLRNTEVVADVLISAKTGEGIDLLFEILKRRVHIDSAYTEQTSVVTNSRHLYSLKKTVNYLKNTLSTIESGLTEEYISVDLRKAINSLGEIIGEVTTDDILNNIFAKFCIGK